MAKSQEPDYRSLVANRTPVCMAWLGLGLPLSVELAADAGWDAALIDQQHGAGGPRDLIACLTAARAARIPAIVRVAQLDFGLIGRALDAGAQGIMVPMIQTAEDAGRLVEYAKYPPLGGRSIGPFRARLLVDGDYFSAANGWTIACGQIETGLAVENIDAICATEGFDMICIGPNDLAISLSAGQNRDIRSPNVLDAIEHVRARAEAHGVLTAIFANDLDFARHVIERGWRIVSVGTDTVWLATMARQMLPR